MKWFRSIYSLLFYGLTPFLLIRLWIKSHSLPTYRHRILERFSLDVMTPFHIDIWIHAVSLGEMIAITPLIEQLLLEHKKILVTTMTPTGLERAQKQFGSQITLRYVPYDFPFALKRFFATYQPRLGIIVETELWPNLIHYARRSGTTLVLFNARLSQRSSRGYRRLSWVFKQLLNEFEGIYTQTQEDAQRFLSIGVIPSKVHVTGNIKFDLEPRVFNIDSYLSFKALWGKERPIVILASTHDDEEKQLLQEGRALQKAIPGVLILIAPRHPERFSAVIQLSQGLGFLTGIRSQSETLSVSNEVVVLDCLGELLGFYHISDYAFVGGSLVPVGGHNVLEPIAMGVPVIVGPYMDNFKSICRDMLAVGGIVQIQSVHDWVEQLRALHQKPAQCDALKAAAQQVLTANRGALKRYLGIVQGLLR